MVDTTIQHPSPLVRVEDAVRSERVREPRARRIPEHWWGYVLLAPAVVMLVTLILYPCLLYTSDAADEL